MQNMITFTTAILEALAAFMAMEPIIYLFTLFLMLFVIRAVKILIS
jgi:hypothetical protein